jgi:hypothetical protein
MPTSTIARPSKIYPNLDFWFEKIPPGNPGKMERNKQNLPQKKFPFETDREKVCRVTRFGEFSFWVFF